MKLRHWRDAGLHLPGGLPTLLLFDFDGTLAPFSVNPDAVVLSGRWRTIFTALEDRGRELGFVSGRSLEDLQGRVKIAGAWYAGSHGMELCRPDGSLDKAALQPAEAAALAHWALVLKDLASGIPGCFVEQKPFSLVFHYRGVEDSAALRDRLAAGLLEVYDGLKQTPELCFLGGKKVAELRTVGGRNKGHAVAAIAGGRPACYAGDDITDEDAFAVCTQLGGKSILVGAGRNVGRASAAHFFAEDCDDLATLFESLATRED